jgi:hypothetical protein
MKYGFIIVGLIPALLGISAILFAPTMAYPYWVGLYIVLFGIGYLVKDRFETARTSETGK